MQDATMAPEAGTSAPRDLPTGTRVAFLLSESRPGLRAELSLNIKGRRAVSGEVVGYAVRSRDAIDLQLHRVVTWTADAQPHGFEVLDPDFCLTVRVDIEYTLEKTFQLLAAPGQGGRACLYVREIPWRCCPACRTEVERGGRFCAHCGAQVGIGTHQPRPMTEPPDGAAVCPGCWRAVSDGHPYCKHCGHDRGMRERLVERTRGVAVRLDLVERRRVVMRVDAVLVRLATERLYAEGGEQLVATVCALEPAGAVPRGYDAPGTAFETRVVVAVPDGDVREAARALLGGEAVRASESKRACPRCQAGAVEQLHCSRCGERVRLLPHPDAGRLRSGHAAEYRRVHDCGAPYQIGRDRHCGGCGVSVGSDAPASERFDLIG
jgi:hypothetical protein